MNMGHCYETTYRGCHRGRKLYSNGRVTLTQACIWQAVKRNRRLLYILEVTFRIARYQNFGTIFRRSQAVNGIRFEQWYYTS